MSRCIDADAIKYPPGYKELLMPVIMTQPTVDAVKVIRCKDCKYYQANVWGEVNGIPLVIGHEICTFWGDGCKTKGNGYCSYAERKK